MTGMVSWWIDSWHRTTRLWVAWVTCMWVCLWVWQVTAFHHEEEDDTRGWDPPSWAAASA